VIACVAAAATLAAQVAVHRLVSAKMLNNFAFLVLSLTMLGFAASGAWLSRHPERWREPLGDVVAAGAVLFAFGLVVGTAVLYPSPPVEDWASTTRSGYLLAFLSCVPLALLYAIAFAGSGLVLGALLASPTLATRRLYALDLAGSAAGAFGIVPAVSLLGAERAATASAALLLLAVLVLVPPRARVTRLLLAAAAAAVVVSGIAPQAVFRLRYARASVLGQTQSGDPRYALEHVAWDPVARIEVSRVPPPETDGSRWPSLFGPDRRLLSRFRLLLTQNNNAFTYAPAYDGDPSGLAGLEQTVYAAAYQASAVARPRVLVIGVGGGIDVLTALAFGASSVVGVEVNGATLDILRSRYRDYFRPWVEDPRVRLVHDEGRHYLASHADAYDVVQLSGVDSVSGTPGAAYVFSESYLYTSEAIDLYLSRLAPDGVLNVMRPDTVPPRDMLRLLVTVDEALRRRGAARPAEHVVVVADRTGQFVAVLVAARPFAAGQLRRIADWTAENPFLETLASPGAQRQPANVFATVLSAPSGPALRAALASYPWDVLPVDDDRPFFFRTSRWSDLWPRSRPDPGTPFMELGLLALLAVTLVAAAVFVYAPLRSLRGLQGSDAGRIALFFAALGLGYMAIEMALIQKFGLLLGHPNHALSVVLATLLLSTGLGSLLSRAIVAAASGRLRLVSYALAAVLLAEIEFAFPRLPGWISLAFAARVGIVAALVLPIGLLLGTFFPTGIDRLKHRAPAWVAWAWGLNGMASVVAPILSVGVSISLGISMVFLAAVPVYLVAGFVEPSASQPAHA
jgi:hypothetical protein